MSVDGKMLGRKMKRTHNFSLINLGENVWDEFFLDHKIRAKFLRPFFTFMVEKACG
jgi:hypothetical protein